MFHLTGIPPAPKGTPRIDVAFEIDTDGIVHVTAKDVRSGRTQVITVESYSGLSQEELTRAIERNRKR
jgi:molecular chaperone DnaK